MVEQDTTSGSSAKPSVRFEYTVPEGAEVSDEELALMKQIDERMKARNREIRKAGRSMLQADSAGNMNFKYKVTMPDGTIVDQGGFSIKE